MSVITETKVPRTVDQELDIEVVSDQLEEMMDLRVRTHGSRGGRRVERRVSRSVCAEFFLLCSVWCFSYVFLYILCTVSLYIYICVLLLYNLLCPRINCVPRHSTVQFQQVDSSSVETTC
jgi:hypothetical protein